MSWELSKSGLARLVALGFIWGSVFMFIKIAGYAVSPLQMVFSRLVLGALVLLPFVFSQGLRFPSGAKVWGHLTVAALLGNAVPWTLFAWGEQDGSSSTAGVINSTTPLWTIVAAFILGQDRKLGTAKVSGLLLGLLGTLLIAAPWNAGAVGSTGSVVAFVVGTVSLGASFAYMGKFLTGRGIPPLVLAAAQLTAASVLLLLALPFAGLQPVTFRLDSALSLLVLGAVCTGLAYVLNFQIIAKDGPTIASTVTYLFPVVSVLLGALVLDEVIDWPVYVGAVASILGITLVRRKPKQVAGGATAPVAAAKG
ncbi:multidrug DMT transporter permease [Saccharothrix sp. NRRL B-16348]|uniref:DMT family transporter n=1 Tax=Saccharothrix sp. NRRL B-16348 TaxID=1415542 RepID=UPI0006AFFC12|nr:DMT family transporter [Saccharothrix sp. NRRL B-16348]KOX30097.1 multidrug DMT transporter permease [Saccharothrix sp. NRRL B-16348]